MSAHHVTTSGLLGAVEASNAIELEGSRFNSEPIQFTGPSLTGILREIRGGLSQFIEKDEPARPSIGFLRAPDSPALGELRSLCMNGMAALEVFVFGPEHAVHEVQEKMAANQLQAELFKFHRELRHHSSADPEIVEAALEMRTMLANVEIQLEHRGVLAPGEEG